MNLRGRPPTSAATVIDDPAERQQPRQEPQQEQGRAPSVAATNRVAEPTAHTPDPAHIPAHAHASASRSGPATDSGLPTRCSAANIAGAQQHSGATPPRSAAGQGADPVAQAAAARPWAESADQGPWPCRTKPVAQPVDPMLRASSASRRSVASPRRVESALPRQQDSGSGHPRAAWRWGWIGTVHAPPKPQTPPQPETPPKPETPPQPEKTPQARQTPQPPKLPQLQQTREPGSRSPPAPACSGVRRRPSVGRVANCFRADRP